MNFVCQQCKQPLHLDASLVDLAPSAYDLVGSSLPPAPSTSHGRQSSGAEKLAQLPAPFSLSASRASLDVFHSPSSFVSAHEQPGRGGTVTFQASWTTFHAIQETVATGATQSRPREYDDLGRFFHFPPAN
ncbi:hypothetical protein NUW54_g12172 [Trametes sanguinea]|uniref:Uncharacterized protein n=1 Tax=Trametes sanguinea TaxID=158606 RepID=A0ACC1N2Q2_9APHY|nr:hypothetical protein NUW54_g12172 [Trametes sanguinea]